MKYILVMNLHVEGPKIQRTHTTKEKIIKEFFNVECFYPANNQELESRFHSFAVENHINCTLRMYQMFP